jgi:hypothetical protein
MGIKSRGNYQVNICTKFDCINRNKKCKRCFKLNEYKSTKTKSAEPTKNE